MPVTTPEWQQMALYAAGGALLLVLLFNIPRIGPVIRAMFSAAVLGLGLFILLQQAPYDPTLSRLTAQLGLDDQRVVGEEVHIRMSPDGHFWARVRINGVERRMLVDSGATVTAISDRTAREAGVERNATLVPVILRTANGVVQAETGTVQTLRMGAIEAQDLKVVISPSLGPVDVLGMNFLSQLASWRVQNRTLVLVPERPSPRG